ncbi:MAG: threonine--tRNA ligase [Candidatus Marinimicrobia bacterium]|jgi:threonyl-tRNA synthetase|nr:threonine--tRNA ligase [Candidatus Neomarinimicrobiota bacterium]MBT3618171.1 threonine--tRNA ligase [Candidatus Neomarinimicrobiota bacterium]MBT3828642.1 threonine--tRNA ligase [Candidatus Neomarinimicrobiota bacterium]MBT3996896.1 threonine--tRNA ligase [Candidatus Neomarinimicrobiota bacterium]MBT4280860.1 threonine--tRNA ligase [Candidatus Neomarinimicrobiota bacterium]
MSDITITLPDKTTKTFPSGTTGMQICESIGPGLAIAAVVAEVNGALIDLSIPIDKDVDFVVIKGESEAGHEVLLHSAAHLLAQAVMELYPNAKLSIGPTIENRFYYDIDFEEDFSESDLPKIEAKMHEISKKNLTITRKELSRTEAIKIFSEMNEPYKVEILDELPEDEKVSIYTQGEFFDLCRGPHAPSTGRIKYFKLLDTSGAYWRGDENNKMLQRIYGTAFSTKKQLNEYLAFLEEAKKRDHRKIGKELKLFTFDEEIGPGLPLWLPNGTAIIDELEKLAKEVETVAGYDRIRTPHLTKGTLYEKSGHLEHYKENMYPAMNVDGTDYYVKPMNCPHHHKVFASEQRSYKDLPVRFSEYGTCYRYEKSGQLFGLMRVRSMQMNDAHIYCTENQFKDEFLAVCNLYLKYFDIFGIEKYEMRLSLHNEEGLGKKYVNDPALWVKTENLVKEALADGEINFIEVPGESAFYGPKIDVQVWSAIGKEFTLATNQVDFAIPERFGLTYIDSDGKDQTPLCIHRAPLSTHERFIGFLIEHYKGDFPLWLAPIQVTILTVSEKADLYAKKVMKSFKSEGFRVTLDKRPDKIGTKIRHAELQKINVMLIIGEKESQSETVSVRRRLIGDKGSIEFNALIKDLKQEINERRPLYQ